MTSRYVVAMIDPGGGMVGIGITPEVFGLGSGLLARKLAGNRAGAGLLIFSGMGRPTITLGTTCETPRMIGGRSELVGLWPCAVPPTTDSPMRMAPRPLRLDMA
jgi:hypothetical protein